MFLAKFELEELITKQIASYLKKNTLSFSQFKTSILSKAPIPVVHSKNVDALTIAKDMDQKAVKEALQKQAYEKQLADDEQQNTHDQEAATKDDALKERTIRELNRVSTKRRGYQNEADQLKQQLAQLLISVPIARVTHQHGVTITRNAIPLNGNRLALSRLELSIIAIENKVQPLLEKEHVLKRTLGKIEIRIQERRAHENEKNKRDQARVGYLNSGEGIIKTLSPANAAQLSQNITEQNRALELKCSDLIKLSGEKSYHAFIKQLPAHLKKSKILPSESEALTNILKFMEQHLQYEQESEKTQERLKKIKTGINDQLKKLQEWKTQLQRLNKNKPNLTEVNKKLLEHNITLALSLEHNTSTYQSLGIPALLTLSLSLLFTIPLILALNGFIPLFTTVALLYTLVSAPPALLFLATIGIGIAAAVYAFKARSAELEIRINRQLIAGNMKHINDNSQAGNILQNTSIPNLERQIKKDEGEREVLTVSLENSQRLAQQTFKQAKEIEPVLASRAVNLSINPPLNRGVVPDSPAVAGESLAPSH